MISILPDDLESEILSRVPAKSLGKWKKTCKRWNCLFRDKNFVEKNQKLGQAPRESILLNNYGVYSISEDLSGIHKNGVEPSSIEFTGKLCSVNDSKDLNIYRMYQCEGLILCSTKGNTRLVVWNPCTGETRSIKPRTRYRWEDTYALGYVSSSSRRSYKILRCCYYENYQKVPVTEFEIYDLSSGSWRVLDYLTRDYIIFCDGVSLKGDTYFVAGDKETGFFLMKFDFKTERFVRLPLPFQSFNPSDTAAISVVKDEKLSVLHQDLLAGSDVMRIWVTNKVDDAAGKDLTWRRDFVLVVDFDRFDDLSSFTNVTSFLLDEENKVAVCCDKDPDDDEMTRIYIVGENMYKELYKDTIEGYDLNWPHVLTYVPSLVQIQKEEEDT